MQQYLLLCLLLTHVIGSDLLLVTSPAGTFKGSTLTSFSGQQYSAFRGIPFALPPVGALRFSKPEPYPKIQGVYDATEEGPVCIQPTSVTLWGPGQEDCLYLNVFLPSITQQDTAGNTDLKKVLVFIHGGAFFYGCANQLVPGDLVVQGNIITVTMNYRLSWLGNVKGKTDKLPGNMGLWDQLMALQWVKDNIRSFGGDPDDVTLGGESMGGESVSAWSILRQGQNLFTKGVLMSGTMFSGRSTLGSSDVLLDELTKRVGCSRPENGNIDNANPYDIDRVVECLQALPEEKFILPVEGGFTNSFNAIDGELFPRPISELIQNETYLSEVGFFSRNYLVSLTNNEGAIYVEHLHGSNADPGPKEVYDALRSRFPLPTPVFDKLYNWYKAQNSSVVKSIYDLLSDFTIMHCSFKFFTAFDLRNRQRSEQSEKSGNAYFLLYDHSPSYAPPAFPGMGHAIDLLYLFDIPPNEIYQLGYNTAATEGFSKVDWQLKSMYIDLLVDFMNSGKPGSRLCDAHKLQWPEFKPGNEYYLRFNPHPEVDRFPLKERREIWGKKLSQWLEEQKKSASKDEL